jgi:hypothetical protein
LEESECYATYLLCRNTCSSANCMISFPEATSALSSEVTGRASRYCNKNSQTWRTICNGEPTDLLLGPLCGWVALLAHTLRSESSSGRGIQPSMDTGSGPDLGRQTAKHACCHRKWLGPPHDGTPMPRPWYCRYMTGVTLA